MGRISPEGVNPIPLLGFGDGRPGFGEGRPGCGDGRGGLGEGVFGAGGFGDELGFWFSGPSLLPGGDVSLSGAASLPPGDEEPSDTGLHRAP